MSGPLLNQYGQPLNTGRYVSAPSRDAGAYRGTIANWHPSRLVDRDVEIRERLTTQRRAADLAANDWAAKSGLRTIADNAVGTGLVPKSSIPHKLLGISREEAAALGEKMEWAFSSWSQQAHARGIIHFEDLQYLGISSILRLGEMLHLPVMLPPENGRVFSLAIQDMNPARLCTPADKTLDLSIRDGIEFSGYGRPVAYWLACPPPSLIPVDQQQLFSDSFVRRPAQLGHRPNVFHLFRYEEEEQESKERTMEIAPRRRSSRNSLAASSSGEGVKPAGRNTVSRQSIFLMGECSRRNNMADFLISYAPLKRFEGGWCDVPGDAGGETCAGMYPRLARLRLRAAPPPKGSAPRNIASAPRPPGCRITMRRGGVVAPWLATLAPPAVKESFNTIIEEIRMSQLPSTNLIPALLTDAAIYKDGVGLLGVGSIEMPDFEFLTESIAGLGIAGEVDAPVVGHLKSMSVKIKWNTCNPTATSLLAPEAHQLEIYASVQHYDAGSGTYVHQPVKVVCKCPPKKVGIGKMEPGKKMEPETELEVYYLKLWQNGQEMAEVDKFNYIFSVQGKDYLAPVRANLGKDY